MRLASGGETFRSDGIRACVQTHTLARPCDLVGARRVGALAARYATALLNITYCCYAVVLPYEMLNRISRGVEHPRVRLSWQGVKQLYPCPLSEAGQYLMLLVWWQRE